MKKYFILLTVLALLVAAAVFAVYADEPQAESQGIWCPQCSKYVPENEWIPWTFNGGTVTEEGHYYLAETYIQTSQIDIPALKFDCLDLRGNAWIAEGIRPIDLSGALAVFDSVGGGTILTTGANKTNGGFANVGEGAQFDLHSGTIQRIVRDDITLNKGGLFFVNGGTVNLHGGKVSGGVVEGTTTSSSDTGRGGNIFLYGGTLTVSGGTLEYGMARLGQGSTAQGGNIYAANGARITISGGAVKGGYSDWDGGNIFVGNAALTLSDTGTITEGHAIRNGGNIAQLDTTAENSVSLLGGEVSGGVAGGTLKDFDADGKIARGGGGGGNYYSYSANGSLTVSNCTVDGDMKFDTIKNVTLSGATKIGLGKANGINVLAGTIMDVSGLTEGAEIYVCAADVFTKPIPEADADRIAGYFKGAIRTSLTTTTDFTLKGTQGTTGYCPHCNESVTWTAGFASDTSKLHRYLTASSISTYNTTISADIVLDLNGFTAYRGNRRIMIYQNTPDVVVMDSRGGGKLEGTGTDSTYNIYGGVIDFVGGGTFTLYSGTMRMVRGDSASVVPGGGVIYSRTASASVTIQGGVISGGELASSDAKGGGNIYMIAGNQLTIEGGIIKGGNAGTTVHGGNIYSDDKVTVSGGVILDGSANYGGNIYSAKEVAVTGGIIWNGTGKSSGNIYTKKATVSGGVIAFGNATTGGGGNLRMGDATSEISGNAVIHSGRATTHGANLYCIQTMTLNIKGGLIAGGKAADTGGNIRTNNTDCVVNITGGLIAVGQADNKGGNVHINNGTLKMTGGVITAGTAPSGGNIYLNNNVYAVFKDDGDDKTPLPVISHGTATTGNGGNIYYYGKSTTDTPAFDCKLQLGNCLISDGSAQYGNNLYIYKLAVLEVLPAFDQETSIYFNSALIPDGTILDTDHVSCDGVFTGKLLFENDATLPEIITVEGSPALVVAKAALMMLDGSVKWFSDNTSAIAAYDAETVYILPDAAEFILPSNDSIENTYVVDLAGKELTVSGEASIKVYCFDSANKDLATNGKVTMDGPTLQNTKDHQVDGVTYITVADQQEANTYTFHCLNMRVASVSVRPSSAGVYYSCIWECDDVVKNQITDFGVAVSVKDMPDADFTSDEDTLYTVMDKSELVIGKAFNSVLIDRILEEGNDQNSVWGTTDIYATPYVTLEGGQKIVCQDDFKQSLKSVLELFDTKAYYANKLVLEDFYTDWEDVFKQWGFTNIGVKPGDDNVLRILMVGNSFCYYYVEELYDMLMMNRPAGVDEVEVYNLYYSGRSLSTHLKKWQDGVGDYQLFRTDKNGRQNLVPYSKWSLEMALAQTNWDYISIQGRVSVTGDDTDYDQVEEKDLEAYAKNIGVYAEPLLAHFHKMFPHTQLLWHRTWVTENTVRSAINKGTENDKKYDKNMQAVCEYMCNEFDTDKDYDLKMVNSGAAWTEARSLNAAKAESLFPVGGLCARLGWNDYDGEVMHSGDGRHEGDIGGGQLLNAYMWYMTITGDADLSEVIDYKPVYKSGSTEYHLSDELVKMLQQAAVTTFASMADQ